VRGFFEQIPAEVVKSSTARIASIGPVTSKELTNFGVKIDLEADEHTIDGVIAELKGFYTRSL
jgi:uroporphyrinogen III methyltransferase/synthase